MLGQKQALDALLQLSEEMMQGGATLIQRVLPQPPDSFTQWAHYPAGDAIDPASKARWYYHAHPPDGRGPREHGHFHLFLPLSAFDGVVPLAIPAPKKGGEESEKTPKKTGAKVVHVAALAFDIDGLPTGWFATNQWVTQEYLFSASQVIQRLDQMEMGGTGDKHGLADIGRWLTLAMRACRRDLIILLNERDAALAQTAPQDRKAEILASRPFTL